MSLVHYMNVALHALKKKADPEKIPGGDPIWHLNMIGKNSFTRQTQRKGLTSGNSELFLYCVAESCYVAYNRLSSGALCCHHF